MTGRIREMSTNARNARSAVLLERSEYNRSAGSSSARWRGRAGDAFSDTSRRASNQVNENVIRIYGNINSQLSTLASSAARAETANRRQEISQQGRSTWR